MPKERNGRVMVSAEVPVSMFNRMVEIAEESMAKKPDILRWALRNYINQYNAKVGYRPPKKETQT